MPRQLSDRQLATLLSHVARNHLEVERGLRDPQQLQRWLAPIAHMKLRQPDRARFRHAGPVTPEDLGKVHLTRVSDNHIYATISTRETDDRWGALMLELRTAPNQQRWWITGLERLRQPPTPDIPPPEHDPASSAAARVQRDSTSYGDRRGTEVPSSTPTTTRNEHAADRTAQDRSDAAALLLGPRPQDDQGRHLWDAASEEIGRYRHRWGLTDYTNGVLGPLPENPQQRQERDRLYTLVGGIGPLLDRALQRDATTRDKSLGLER